MSKSDGSTADYYELPAGCTELQDLISHRDLNAQLGEIFRACYRYGHASHSDKMRDAKKIRFYADAEVKRLEKLEQQKAGECEGWIKPAPRMFRGGPIKDGVMYLVGEQFDDFGAPLPLEPAASIDDDSARMQAIGQNGNTGEHYDGAPRWDDAPEWANWLIGDSEGYFWTSNEPEWCDIEVWDNRSCGKMYEASHEPSAKFKQSRPTKEAI